MKHFFKNILTIILIFVFLGFSQDKTFEHLDIHPGVTHNLTNAILQDSKDFIWFGTIYGLVRYDGHNFKYYQNIVTDSTSLSANNITCLFEDNCDNIWVGTRGGGLNRLDPKTNLFSRYTHNPQDPSSISNNTIQAICEDIYGNIWIGTQNGLNKIETDYCENKVTFKKYFLDLHNTNSLTHNSIRALYCTPVGNLWIGTDNGLNVYNQQNDIFNRFFHYDSASTVRYNPKLIDFISKILDERPPLSSILNITDFQNSADTFTVNENSEYLLINSGEGYYYYAGELLNKLYDTGWLESIPDNKIIWKTKFKESLYAGGGQKNRIKIETIKLSPGSYRLRYISDDSHSTAHWNHHPPEKTKWYGIQLVKITKKEKELINNFLKKSYLEHPNSLSDHTISSIVPDANPDILWIGTNYGGLNRLDILSKTFSHFKYNKNAKNTIPSNYITTIIPDTKNSFWIGTAQGLSHFNATTKTFTNYKHKETDINSLSSNHVASLLKDRSGLLWIGTRMGSIEKLSNYRQKFERLHISGSAGSSLNNNNILSVFAVDTTTLWFGTNASGLFKYNLHTGKAIQYLVNTPDRNLLDVNIIRTLTSSDPKHLWIGTFGGGLIKLNIHTGSSKRYSYASNDPSSLSSNYIQTLFVDSKNRLWIGTNGYGLNLAENNRPPFKRFFAEKNKLNTIGSNTIYSITEDAKQNVWFGTCNGLTVFNDATKLFKHFTIKNKSNSVCIYDILIIPEKNNDVFWLATSGGLLKFDPSLNKYIQPKNISELKNESIMGIEYSDDGNLWCSTNKGLAKYHINSGIIKWYDTDDGLQSNIFNLNAHIRLENSKLIFAGINGFNVIDPKAEAQNDFIPKIQFSAFKVFGKERNLNYDEAENPFINLSYKDNFFSIEFAALDFKKPVKNHYKYRLSGIDNDWVYLKNGNSASYTNIKPGTYTFEVQGTNSNGIWNPKTTMMQITIVPPFWKTAWFTTILIISFLGLIAYIIYSIRLKEKKRTELNKRMSELKLQALRSRMNPHFIFNTINSIQYFISENAQKDAYFYLSKFSKLLRTTLNVSELASVPLIKELEILELYLTLQKLRFEDKLKYELKIAPEIDSTRISIPSMLIQPYVENAIEHGIPFSKQTGTVKINIKKNGVALICAVEDDGIGINKSLKQTDETDGKHSPKGMQLTRERLRIINESIENNIDVKITDLSDLSKDKHGTQVIIHIPYKNI